MKFNHALLFVLVTMLFSSSCALMHQSRFPDHQAGATDADGNEQPRYTTITAELLREMQRVESERDADLPGVSPPSILNWEYRAGIGDVLSIVVFDHPQLTIPAGPSRSASEDGHFVQTDGSIYYPFIGKLFVEGQSLAEIRDAIAAGLKVVIPSPQVDVRVAKFGSQKVMVSGFVTNPGMVPITNTPLTLIEAIELRGGFDRNVVDLTKVRLVRDIATYEVDLLNFLERGDAEDNPILLDGDVIVVPKRQNNEVYVLGEVTRVGAVPITDEKLSLTDSLAMSGGLSKTSANATGIFVFRRNDGNEATDIYQLNVRDPAAFVLGVNFGLRPLDVIYVTAAPAARWSRLIRNLLPSLSAVNSLLLINDAVTDGN